MGGIGHDPLIAKWGFHIYIYIHIGMAGVQGVSALATFALSLSWRGGGLGY